ncbi:MAG: HEAT repeat domain-containing protein, partial [Holophaga sp.]|nr:HEAT repeat domain-containing protein [Holophaga sp.]
STLGLAAESLGRRVGLGFLGAEAAVAILLSPFRLQVGGEPLLVAFLSLLPAHETTLLDGILADSDHRRRQRCIEVLGNREDDAFSPFFLKALQDSIVDVGQVASHHLSKLPSSLPSLMAQFQSGHQDQIRRAIWAFGENQIQAAAPALLEFIRTDPNDQLLVEAIDALASISHDEAVSTFMDLLHDGKPLALQLSLARALGLLAQPQASLGLLEKAPLLKHPQVLILCLEGALRAFPGFEKPLPPDHLPALIGLVERCCDEREGEGQRVPAMLAMLDLYTFEQNTFEQLKDRFSDFLFNMRTKENWDRDSNERVAAVVKELGRRSSSLALLAKKESEISSLIQKLSPGAPRRTENLLALREALSDPEFILRSELAIHLAKFVETELQNKNTEWKEIAYLCEIGGLTRQALLTEPIRAIFTRATGVGLKSSARKALLNLGLSEAEINRKPPIKSILVLEPSAFFRKRLVSSLSNLGRWQIQEAGNRTEAKAILDLGPVDLLISESQDPDGDLGAWLQAQADQGHYRSVFFSVSSRDL